MIVDYKRMSDLFDDNLQSMRAPSSVPYPSLYLSPLVRDDEEQIGPCFRALSVNSNLFTTSDLSILSSFPISDFPLVLPVMFYKRILIS
jgi:hypothetical protein